MASRTSPQIEMLLAQIEGVKANTALTNATAELRSAETEAVRAQTRSQYGKQS